MPNPKPGESRDDFLDRCIPILISEGNDPDQAVAVCISYYEGEKDKAFNLEHGGYIEYWKAFDRRRESFESKYTKRIKKAIREQLSIYEDATNFNDLRKTIPPEPLRKAYEELYVEVGDTFARATWSGLKSNSSYNIKELAPPNYVERMQMVVFEGKLRDRMADVDEYTKDQIASIIAIGIDEGLGIEDIKRRIVGTTALQPLNGTLDQRARRIARTEIVTASNKGSLEGAKSTGLNFAKEWVTTVDGRERSAHRAMNGIRALDGESFDVNGVKMEYPGDPAGGAKNVINCRCAMVFVTGDELGPVSGQTINTEGVPEDRYPMMAYEVEDRKTFIEYLASRNITISNTAVKKVDNAGMKEMAKMHEFCLDTFGEDAYTYQHLNITRSSSNIGEASITGTFRGGDKYTLSGEVKMNTRLSTGQWYEVAKPSAWNSGKGYMTTYLHEMIHHYDYSYTAKKIAGYRTTVLTTRQIDELIANSADISSQIRTAIIEKYGREEAERKIKELGTYAFNKYKKGKPNEIPTLAFEKYYSGQADEFAEFIVKTFIQIYKSI